MAATSLEFLILAKDQASEAFDSVAKAVERQHSALDKLKGAGAIASAALVAGVAKFGSDSVEAYSEAERKQTLLQEAFKKFPNLADTSIGKLNELNDAIQRKTGYDNDDLAASQASLAQYGLTGDQVAKLTPLVADYAAKTGKDLPTAAEAVGKAMLGQGRALKDVGINFKDTHTVAGNFQELMGGLKEKVGGVADAMGQTATGKVQILSKSFEDFQEKIGGMLVPVLTTLVGIGQKVLDWMAKNPAIVQTLAVVIGVLTIAIIAATAAMWALSLTPVALIIGLIVIAIAALIAIVVLLVTHWKQVTQFLQTVWANVCAWLQATFNNIGKWWNSLWSGVASFFKGIWDNITGWVSGVWGNITGAFQRGLSVIGDAWNGLWSGLAGIARGALNGAIDAISGGLNAAIDLVNGAISGINSVGGAVGIHIGAIPHVRIPHFADGGVAPGGVALVGERGPELVNLPGGSRVTPNGGVIRLHPDDIMAIGSVIMSGINRGATKAITEATW